MLPSVVYFFKSKNMGRLISREAIFYLDISVRTFVNNRNEKQIINDPQIDMTLKINLLQLI